MSIVHHSFSKKDLARAMSRPENVRLVYVSVRDPYSKDVMTVSTIMETKYAVELMTFILGHGTTGEKQCE